MKFNFENLDEHTRQLMLDEINYDINNHQLYFSKRFNDNGVRLYPTLLQQSVTNGDEQSLALTIRTNDCFKEHEERRTKSGVTLVKVPETANQILAESEFNRFYIRALCVRAIKSSMQLKVYRGRYSDNPRVESEMMIGKTIDAVKLLDDLRTNIGVDTALGLPSGPNSGLTVKLL